MYGRIAIRPYELGNLPFFIEGTELPRIKIDNPLQVALEQQKVPKLDLGKI